MLFKINEKKYFYHATPKCGCTSTKIMISSGLQKKILDETENINIHNKYPTSLFKKRDADVKFCIIREPVDRFISGYSNRVLFHKQIECPDFNYFVDNFYHYYKNFGTIKHHFRPQVDYIGIEPEYYTHIFELKKFHDVGLFLKKCFNYEIEYVHKQTGGNDMKPIPTEQQKEFIREFYKKDYNFIDSLKEK